MLVGGDGWVEKKPSLFRAVGGGGHHGKPFESTHGVLGGIVGPWVQCGNSPKCPLVHLLIWMEHRLWASQGCQDQALLVAALLKVWGYVTTALWPSKAGSHLDARPHLPPTGSSQRWPGSPLNPGHLDGGF